MTNILGVIIVSLPPFGTCSLVPAATVVINGLAMAKGKTEEE